MNHQPKTVFLPHLSEFGWFVMRHIRTVHVTERPNKVVCCRPGQEVYFPTAGDFFYDWTNPIHESNRSGSMCNYLGDSRVSTLAARIAEQFTGCELIGYGERCPDHALRDVWFKGTAFELRPRRRDLRVDLVLAPRNRRLDPHRNWPEQHWHELVAAITAAGYSYAIAGMPETSFDLPNASHRTWEFPDADAEVELIQNCRVFIGVNSGTTHLACFLQAPTMALFCGYKEFFADYMRWANPNLIEIDAPEVDGVITKALAVLAESKARGK